MGKDNGVLQEKSKDLMPTFVFCGSPASARSGVGFHTFVS
jgi:hypothetical protein